MMVKFCNKFQLLGALAIVLIGAGCGDEATEPPEERPQGRFALTSHENWSSANSDSDPFADRPTQVDCPANALGPEELNGENSFAVLTDFCSYVTARQSTNADVFEGDLLHFRVFHFALEAEEPSEAHVALRIGDQMLLDERIEIPSESGLLAGDVPAQTDMPAGTPVYFHVHNHGANEYSLVELTAEAP